MARVFALDSLVRKRATLRGRDKYLVYWKEGSIGRRRTFLTSRTFIKATRKVMRSFSKFIIILYWQSSMPGLSVVTQRDGRSRSLTLLQSSQTLLSPVLVLPFLARGCSVSSLVSLSLRVPV